MSEALVFRCGTCGQIVRVPAARRWDGAKCGRCKAKLDVTGQPQDVSDAELQRAVASSPVAVLVDFWAPWCGPCRQLAPHIAELAGRHAGKLLVLKVNTEEQRQTAAALGIRSIPTLCVYRGGELVFRQPGAVFGPQLEAVVAPYV
ncbi:MAG TPA: thioredoxin domain-containing protein [Nannocystis sp.]